MKKEKLISLTKRVLLLLLLTSVLLVCAACGGTEHTIVVEGELSEGDTIEYTGGRIQFPVAHIADSQGKITSYNVLYKVINLADQSELTDEYAAFELKPGAYQIVYTYGEDDSLNKTVSFDVVDTTAPAIEFMEIPNGLFLQDITEDSVNKLPLYSMEDASSGEGIDLKQTLKFKGEGDADFKEYPFRQINNSYEISSFGTFVYELTAVDCYGNTTTVDCQWKVKDRTWKPEKALPEGILADYSEEGYCNLVEGGDVNQYYKIDNDYSDSYLAEFEGAQGVLKIDMGFNNAAGYGNNTIRLRIPNAFTKEDLAGKYLAVRMYVEGEHLRDTFLIGGNNVEFREQDATTRAFTADMTGLETGKWMTFYLEASAVENIGMYPNATYNPETTFYEGGDPADAIQLCFHRESGYFNDMTLYVDSVSIAELLPDTTLTISGKQASWTEVEGAAGYRVVLNGEETILTETSVALPGEKGYIRVTPMGNGATTLDAKTVTGVYGLDAGNSIAKFDDPLYAELFNDRLAFSTENEHNGYRPRYLNSNLTSKGLEMEIGTGAWGVVTGVRFQFPKTQEKDDNTTLVLNMQVDGSEYGQIRVYDYTGKQLGVIKLDESNTGKFCEFKIDISGYKGTLEGIQLIFGPNETFTSVSRGVTVTFKKIYLNSSSVSENNDYSGNGDYSEETFYPITVDGQDMQCAGRRKLKDGHTTNNLVQFINFYNFGVPADNTPLGFSGTVLLDGKKVNDVTVVGYPGSTTICFTGIPHKDKVLTIMKDSVIYYNGIAVIVDNTFNAKWDGSKWVAVAEIPAEPAPEYITLADGSVKTVQNKVELEAGYTANGVVQFLNVYDFGVTADDTPLGFEGTVMLDGEIVHSPLFVGYPSNTTIALKAPHQGKVLTIMKDSVIYYGDSAVVVTETFNAKWDGNEWTAVSDIPEVPEPQYVTLADGTTRELMANVTLVPGYTTDNLIQFPDIYDFGAPADSTPIGFEGTVLLQGAEVKDPSFNGYLNSTTIGLEKLSHKGKVVTILEGAIIYNDTAAVRVKSTFNAMWDGSAWIYADEIPEPEEPEQGILNFKYRYGESKLIQVNTNLPVTTPIKDFTASDNGCVIDQTGNPYQQVGWIQMANADGTIVLTFHFNNAFEAGQYYILPEGSVFGFTNGSTYTLDGDYVFLWDGENWTVTDTIPEEPEEPEQPEQPEEPEQGILNFKYRYGESKLIQVNTNLPVTTPIKDFTASDNGCVIDQSGNPYQQVGWIQMAESEGTIVLTFHFNGEFEAGQYYILPAGSVFGFTNGSTYTLDGDYVFLWDGENWTVSDTIPEEPEQPEEPEEPEQGILNFKYRYGESKLIQVNTNLPVTTPIKDFTASDNGCVIDQTGNPYQQVGWIQMANADDTIVLTFNFNNAFEAGQYYILPAGSVFGFTDGKTYTLNDTYVFIWDGENWTVSDTVPEEPEEPEEPEVPEKTDLNLQYQQGSGTQIAVSTDLPITTPIKDFTASENGCVIDQSANLYQQVGWFGMMNVQETVVLTFNFNNAFEAGQYYILPAGSVFGFTDGKTYTLNDTYVFIWDGENWTVSDTVPEEPEEPEEPEVPEKTDLNLVYQQGSSTMIAVSTDLPATTPIKDFTASENGCVIDQTGNPYQQVGWFGMMNVQETVVLTFNFNNAFEAGQYYILPAGSVFGFTDGKTYTLNDTYVFIWDGENWTVSDTVPEESEEPEQTEVSFVYNTGTSQMIGVATNLPASTPCANFLATDNGCNIDQSGNIYQQVGYIQMVKQGDTIGLAFIFNNAFEAGQYYILPADSVFGFTDGKTYTLNDTYVFIWDGENWTVSDTIPEEPEEPEVPEKTDLNLVYQQGSSTMIAVSTDLPATTPIKDFTASENGCVIDQSANLYQQVGWFDMMNVQDTVVLTFNFNNAFEAGQYYILPAGSVFGFTDGKTYTLNDTYVFIWDGENWTVSDTVPEEPEEPEEPEVPEKTDLNLVYQQGSSTMIAVSTDLPVTTPIKDFTASENGCVIDQTGNPYQQVGWFGMMNVQDTVVLTFNFNNAFEAGQYYILPAGSVFGFTDGRTYPLDKDYIFVWDGSSWSLTDTVPEFIPSELSLQYYAGANNVIGVATNLPSSTPLANFTASDNGCVIDQSDNPYQQVGYVEMVNQGGTIGLLFHFNSGFEAGQYYILPAGSVFGFTDGRTYPLDKDYIFVWDGSSWSLTDTVPEFIPSELSLQYYAGANNVIGVATNLPSSTPLANFTASDNGCVIDQSDNPYQQVGYIEMVNQGGTIGLLFHFNSGFEAGQYYILPAGSVFGFTDGKTYTLNDTYVFIWDGENWTVSDTVPEESEEPEQTEVSFVYNTGTSQMIGVATNLPASTPCANFLATDNGCNIDQSGNIYQQVGYIQMVKQGDTIGLAFIFNNAFEAGQYYILPAGSVFGFTDGKTYTLNDTYVFIWDGSNWTVSDTIPEEPEEPEQTEVSFVYNTGTSQMIGVATNLPASTPCANFLATDNGCNIDQSGNIYQQVGYIQMVKQGDTIGLAFIFNNAFEAGQYYILPAGSVFGFTDGSSYTLDKTYVFVWDGSSWTVSNTIPTSEGTEETDLNQQGNEMLLSVSTDLPATTSIGKRTASYSIDQSGKTLLASGLGRNDQHSSNWAMAKN